MPDVSGEKIEAKKSLLPLPGFVDRKPETLSPKSALVTRRRVVCLGSGSSDRPFILPSLNVVKTILEVSNLSIHRGKTVILEDLSWRIERGQHWAMLGANGSGKTSLLSALTGYLSATSGEIELLGQKFGR